MPQSGAFGAKIIAQCAAALRRISRILAAVHAEMPTMTAIYHPDYDHLLTEVQAAELLGLSVRTLQAWRVRGSMIPYVRCGRAVRYRASDVRAWIAAHTVTSTTEADAREAVR
jgi:excisionase family DNA binding protein